MTPFILKAGMVIFGIIIFNLTFYAYARKKLTEKVSLIWCLASLIMIATGIIPVLSSWSDIICAKEYTGLIILFIMIIMIMFKFSTLLSQLYMKNQELAMHVSLLNQENERILAEIEAMTGKEKAKI